MSMSSRQKDAKTTSQADPNPPFENINPIMREPLPDGYTAVFEPNNFKYKDSNGIEHNKHMPRGTFRKALKYYEQGNWGNLAKYPAWSNGSCVSRNRLSQAAR